MHFDQARHAFLHALELLVGAAQGREPRDGRLDDQAHFHEVDEHVARVERDELEARDEVVGRGGLDVGALALPDLDRSPGFQRDHRFPEEIPAHLEPLGEDSLGRKLAAGKGRGILDHRLDRAQ
ncbi:hypothetical protein SDC9_188468 [bioreactor metagenome]|uniref:Uncharacterized protein n=1 Tax=bioreactor metagenome TaxID=1076179 RepID=A0A645HPG0_9ZZZZ